MKISNNFLASIVIIFILISIGNVILKEKVDVTGKYTSGTGTASLRVLPLPIAQVTDLQIFLNEDNVSVDLNWTIVAEATSYNVYYSSNLTELNNIDVFDPSAGITTISGITDNNWTDGNADAVTARYYKVAAVKNNGINASDKSVGKYTYIFYGTNNPSNAHRAENWISIPFNVSFTAESLMDDMGGNIIEKMTKLIRQDASTYQFYTHIHNLNDGKDFNVLRGEGYAIFVNQTINHTLIGDAVIENINYTFYGENNPTNAHRTENWFSIPFNVSYYSESYMDDIGSFAEKMTKLVRADATTYQFYTHIHNLNDGKNFGMAIAEGYAIFVNQSLNYTSV
jgi:hypothetical protein